MLVKFSLENWMSFRDRVEFSMVATSERQHGNRVPRIRKYRARILPIAALYGGNASGKSNFFHALNFAQKLVVRGTETDGLIPVEPFRLDAKEEERPSRFYFELLIDETIYEFSFAVTRKEVVEEKLVVIGTARETVLYDRCDGRIQFDAALQKDKFLQFAFQGTRDNQLFLTNSVSQKVNRFRRVYDWFRDNLKLVGPESWFSLVEQLVDSGHPLHSVMSEKLSELDTGIARLSEEEAPMDKIPLPKEYRTELDKLNEGETKAFRLANERFVVGRKAGALIGKKLVAVHPRADGAEVKFNLDQESDGTQRIIDLLPAFFYLSEKNAKNVFAIDEVDRSLHTLLIRRLLEAYLASCSAESRSQLLLTTHDVLLMDQELLRRDEMWVAERDSSGASHLLSFSSYKDVRYDKDIRKSYLQGRLGGIPRMLFSGALAASRPSEQGGG